jgi:hypothetical protein
MNAKYLIRFDDICPTMNWEVWNIIEKFMLDAGVKPILAVVPDNRDQKLAVSLPRDNFWEKVRNWQSWGWTIGLHGYQHCYVTENSGLMRINPYSEFAGLPLAEQTNKLDNGLKIFQDQQVRPDIWVSPAHSFDDITVTALRERGISLISDGFTFFPFRDSKGSLWIPQQMWSFHYMPFGMWTICFHHNAWTKADLLSFCAGINRFGSAIISVEEVIAEYGERIKNDADRVMSCMFPFFICFKKSMSYLSRNLC